MTILPSLWVPICGLLWRHRTTQRFRQWMTTSLKPWEPVPGSESKKRRRQMAARLPPRHHSNRGQTPRSCRHEGRSAEKQDTNCSMGSNQIPKLKTLYYNSTAMKNRSLPSPKGSMVEGDHQFYLWYQTQFVHLFSSVLKGWSGNSNL